MPCFPYFLSRVDISGPYKACACGATSISAVRHPNNVSAFVALGRADHDKETDTVAKQPIRGCARIAKGAVALRGEA